MMFSKCFILHVPVTQSEEGWGGGEVEKGSLSEHTRHPNPHSGKIMVIGAG